jgi:adenylate cyclase, class 2
VAEVHKRRRALALRWQGHDVEVALDQVERLGTFVELEIVSDQVGLDAARACLASLAAELQLISSERRSYLELLLEKRGGPGQQA